MAMPRRITLALFLCAAAVAQTHAQDLADYDYENLAFRGVGLDYGHIWPSKVAATAQYSARVDLGYLGPGVRIAPSLSFWTSDLRAAELGRFADRLNRLRRLQEQGVTLSAADLGQIEWSDLSVSLDAHYVWTTPLKVITYAGLGGALHMLNGQGEAIADTFVEDLLDSFSAGGALMTGLEYEPIRRVRLYGELRYNFLGDVQYPGLRIGAAVMFSPGAGTQSGRTQTRPSSQATP